MMRGLTAAEVIEVWERGAGRPVAEQALIILDTASATDDQSAGYDRLALLPLGQRDALLLTVREATLGETLNAWVRCPQCGERLELVARVAELRGPLPRTGLQPHQPPMVEARVGEAVLRARLPTSLDLLALHSAPDVGTARQQLIERCLTTVEMGDAGGVPAALSEAMIAALADAMDHHSSQVETVLDVACPACLTRWPAALDIAAFLCQELAAQAQRLVREIHVLARAYGWREADILALSARRRQMYLELIESS